MAMKQSGYIIRTQITDASSKTMTSLDNFEEDLSFLNRFSNFVSNGLETSRVGCGWLEDEEVTSFRFGSVYKNFSHKLYRYGNSIRLISGFKM